MKQLLKNRKAKFNYELIEEFEAGLVLKGIEIKSLVIGKASLTDSYCYFEADDLYVNGLRIENYRGSGDPDRSKKLLLHKKELKDLKKSLEQKGLTIIPYTVYLKNGKAKMKIFLAKGKNNYDKRNSIKDKDERRDRERYNKEK